MKLYNSLTKRVEELETRDEPISIYSCGPTVYDHAHIGNLVAFLTTDLLGRVLRLSGNTTKHVMNITDIDDKTIKASQKSSINSDPIAALKEETRKYEKVFFDDLSKIGVDTKDMIFIRATDSIDDMLNIITKLLDAGVAYIAEDGIYFSIDKYKKLGKKYGQLVEITAESTGAARITNDEYDKDNIHDFSLWKTKKEGEPSWVYSYKEQKLDGRPGWHIECSAMSESSLGLPFDIHTGGIDLAFPHHENEIAQSTATSDEPLMARWFVHNEHLLVDNKKMSKSLGNFYTLQDITDKGFDPLAFRFLVLRGHYRRKTNFSWDNLESAQNRLNNLRNLADLRFQPLAGAKDVTDVVNEITSGIVDSLSNDLDTPQALAKLSKIEESLEGQAIPNSSIKAFTRLLETVDQAFGLQLTSSADISSKQKQLVNDRQQARETKDFAAADKLREQLAKDNIEIKDTPNGPIWRRTS